MPLPVRRSAVLSLSAAAIAILVASPVSSQQAAGPIARYDMDVGTVTGLAAMGSGMGAGLSMMFGGGGNKQAHELILRLGSSSAPAGGAPKADHFMPAVAKLGASVPLVSPKPGTRTDVPEELPKDFQRPKGRLLIYWGCGAKAGPAAGGDRFRQADRRPGSARSVCRRDADRSQRHRRQQPHLWRMAQCRDAQAAE